MKNMDGSNGGFMPNFLKIAQGNPFSLPFQKVKCDERRSELGHIDTTTKEVQCQSLPDKPIDLISNVDLNCQHLTPIPSRNIRYASSGGVAYASPLYYGLCGFGGIISCGLTHTAILPLDLVKCRMQVDSTKYPSLLKGLVVSIKEDGVIGLFKGWVPTFLGYGAQGCLKFGLYEVFKKKYGDAVGPENFYRYTSLVYLAASATAEFFADIPLSPFESMKVRIQTVPGFPSTMRGAFPAIMSKEGIFGFYKSLVPLWGRQIPYTMAKFASFEKFVELIYKYMVPTPRDQVTKAEQLVVTFSAGYIAGIFCAIVSHPADTMVSKLQEKGTTIGSIYKKIGFGGLWKGLIPRIIMIGTLTGLQWFIYDGVKVTFNLPKVPPPQKPPGYQ